jgi:hypothetical protein
MESGAELVGDHGHDGRYRSARRRSRWAILFVGLATGIIGLEILVVAHGFSFVDRFGRVTLAEISTWQRNLNTISGLYYVAIVPAAIASLAWLSRVVDNIPALTGEQPWVTPRWAIALWFVPLASFVAPYRIVADAWRRLAETPAGRSAAIVAAWWILFLGGGAVNRLISATVRPAETPAAFSGLLTWITGAAIVQLVAGVLFIWIVRTIERRSTARDAANVVRDAAARLAGDTGPIEGVESPAVDVAIGPTPG